MYFPYNQGQARGGHFRIAQQSGSIVSMGPNGYIASLRWPEGLSTYLAVLGIRANIQVVSPISVAVALMLKATIARDFSTDFTTQATAGVPSRMRDIMGKPACKPKICTVGTMSGQTLSADGGPFAMEGLVMRQPTNATGAVTTLAVGDSTETVDLYKFEPRGGHPPVLSAQEGVVIQSVNEMFVSGAWQIMIEWEVAEVFGF